MNKTIKISETELDLAGLVAQLEEDMSGMFNGHMAGLVEENVVEFVCENAPAPDPQAALANGGLFLPFTSPDAEGGMVYGDGSPVHFDDVSEEEGPGFAESDCFGFLISRRNGEVDVRPGLCSLNTLGPCSIHHFEVEAQSPGSAELRGRMEDFLMRFINGGKTQN